MSGDSSATPTPGTPTPGSPTPGSPTPGSPTSPSAFPPTPTPGSPTSSSAFPPLSAHGERVLPGENADAVAGVSSIADADVGVPSVAAAVPTAAVPTAAVPTVPTGGGPGWYSRGYLPHRDHNGLLQSVTFRLADSLPQAKLRELEIELDQIPQAHRDLQRRRQIEQWLDSGLGCCALGHPAAAQQVQDSLLHFHGERYRLLAWCIMPNLVHVLLEVGYPLAKIVQGWKSFTARWALSHNEQLRLGIESDRTFWMREYWDRYIRDDGHRSSVIEYIHNNPVKAGLCEEPKGWRWSSAHPGNADVLVGTQGRE